MSLGRDRSPKVVGVSPAGAEPERPPLPTDKAADSAREVLIRQRPLAYQITEISGGIRKWL